MIIDLTKRYTELHRRYHDLEHPIEMITIGQAVYDLTDDQIAAIWYHDAIYVAGDPLNEKNSADLFMRHYQHRWTQERKSHLDVVYSIIMDTKYHIPSSEEAKSVLDLDLMGLGDPFQDYWQSAKWIREEFHKFSDEEWNKGRTKFLESMLDKERIFWTDFGDIYERPARINMERELQLLRNGTARYV